MEDQRLARALSWVAGGGTALAAGALLLCGLYAITPDGLSPTAELSPCVATGCSWAPAPAATAKPTAPTLRSRRGAPARAVPTTVARAELDSAPQAWTDPVIRGHLAAPVVAMAMSAGSPLMVGSDGGVFPVGRAGFYGSIAGSHLDGRITAAGTDPTTGGYWLAASDGGVFALNAPFYGSLSGKHLAAPVVGMAVAPGGAGYWLVSSDGGVFTFGAAPFFGSASAKRLSSGIVGIVATPDGGGYWLVSSDGGVFAFGDAAFYGSASRAGRRLTAPVVAMAATTSGAGYWLVGADGGVFAFGDATYHGNAVGAARQGAVTAIVATTTDNGYWLADQGGDVFAFGDATQVAPAATATAGSAPATAGPATTTSPSPAARPEPAAAGRPARAATALPNTMRPVGRGVAYPVRYGAGQSGLDISQYQCNQLDQLPARSGDVAVVQVTGGGLEEPPNPCYLQEVQWAGPDLSVYIYMDGLPSPAPAAAAKGPAGHCQPANLGCQSYNYGYNEAVQYVSYSRHLGVDPQLWWLDVERYSGWGGAGANSLTIRGALAGLAASGVRSGIYSTATQWNQITGGLSVPGEAEWTPGAGNQTGPGYSATSFCADPSAYTFGGGRLEMVQYGYSGPFPGSYTGQVPYDQDYACN